jgi:hypothetical protein
MYYLPSIESKRGNGLEIAVLVSDANYSSTLLGRGELIASPKKPCQWWSENSEPLANAHNPSPSSHPLPRLAIQSPPGHGKTARASQLMRHPEEKLSPQPRGSGPSGGYATFSPLSWRKLTPENAFYKRCLACLGITEMRGEPMPV